MKVTRLDTWWEVHSAGRRYDRGPMYFWMILASFLSGVSLILIGPVPSGSIEELSAMQQHILAWTLTLGSFVSLFAATTGSRFWFPSLTRVQSYGLGLTGIPLITSAYLFYSYAVVANTPNFASALGGTLVPCLALGTAINGVFFFLEVRRIQRNVKTIIESDEMKKDDVE